MPLFKCKDCHCEWESAKCDNICRECCTNTGKIVEENTPLEKLIKDLGTAAGKKWFSRLIKNIRDEKKS